MMMETLEFITLILGIITTLTVAITWLIRFVYNKGVNSVQHKNRMETLQQEHENLPCIKDNLFIDTVKESVKISRSNNEILQDIGKWIMKFDLDMIDTLSRKFSPRKMTPVGKLFYEESYAKQVLENNIDFL